MLTRKDLARKALAAALEIRKTKENFVNPICIYDLAEELNIGVWFAEMCIRDRLWRGGFH